MNIKPDDIRLPLENVILKMNYIQTKAPKIPLLFKHISPSEAIKHQWPRKSYFA
mgnify:CR=1 FL=1